jgi:hypothetical protein
VWFLGFVVCACDCTPYGLYIQHVLRLYPQLKSALAEVCQQNPLVLQERHFDWERSLTLRMARLTPECSWAIMSAWEHSICACSMLLSANEH